MLSIPPGIPFTPAIKSNFVSCQHEPFGFWAAAIGTIVLHTVVSSNTVQRSCSFMSPQRRLNIFSSSRSPKLDLCFSRRSFFDAGSSGRRSLDSPSWRISGSPPAKGFSNRFDSFPHWRRYASGISRMQAQIQRRWPSVKWMDDCWRFEGRENHMVWHTPRPRMTDLRFSTEGRGGGPDQ